MEIEEGYCDNLVKQVSGDCVPDIWADSMESMIQESNEETSKAVLSHRWMHDAMSELKET